MAFDAADPERLQSILAKYVVLTRGEDGCRNVDLCLSLTDPMRFVVIEKWESPVGAEGALRLAGMVDMARACEGVLAPAPAIDLLEGISAHDLP